MRMSRRVLHVEGHLHLEGCLDKFVRQFPIDFAEGLIKCNASHLMMTFLSDECKTDDNRDETVSVRTCSDTVIES